MPKRQQSRNREVSVEILDKNTPELVDQVIVNTFVDLATPSTPAVDPEFVRSVRESKKYFRNPLAEFVYYTSYSRWLETEGRRETWIETIDRYIDFMRENLGEKLKEEEYSEVRQFMLEQKVVPSMRLMWSAGKAARATNVAAYNCSFIAPSKVEDFGEIMYISMCGCGVGFSVEEQTVDLFPKIEKQKKAKAKKYVIEDSKEGWATAFVDGVKAWFAGEDYEYDYSQLRPAGARLKTMGGRSSGPQPLRELIDFTREKILSRQDRKLSTLDVHDICCKIGEIVVAGGVRRSAMISLSDLHDEQLRDAKQGQFWNTEPQRSLSNNSAVYNEKPSSTEFLTEWLALAKSGTGERGIFNRGSLQAQLPARRWEVFKKDFATSGTNPCGEIVLKNKQFCNLTSIVPREDDTEDDIMQKIRVATILGTYQSTLTYFPFLSKEWKEHCEEERLLGVSVTDTWGSPLVRNEKVLRKMRDYSIEVNKEYAQRFGVNSSTCVTCVKPSGNSSQLLDCASGLHPRHAPYYIRRVRVSATDPIFMMLKQQGIPYSPEVGQSMETATTFVLEFPIKSPDGATFKNDQSAIEQLELWKIYKQNFTEHNPSVTISVGDDEWLEVANWVYTNWDIIGGLSFLPRSDHKYELAPYEEISKEKYMELASKLPEIDFSNLVLFEYDDETKGAKELACVGDKCEVV
ncbi:MAG: ribonucleoside-triphosphate reductase [Candidatus Doudnabacteria bacterium]|nr:ribonucleoside-triphosphate reductase [Candidatus Doudnabacteria bacterium]